MVECATTLNQRAASSCRPLFFFFLSLSSHSSSSLSLSSSPLSQGRSFVDLRALSLVHGGEVSGSDGWSDQQWADGVQPELQGRAVRWGAGAGQLLQHCKWTAVGTQTSRLINNKISSLHQLNLSVLDVVPMFCWFTLLALFLSYLYLVIILLLYFLHRSQCSSCSMSQSKSTLILNALPNENTNTIQSNRFVCHHTQ